MKLDLHGVKHENVSRLIDHFIWDNLQRSVQQVIIVTGNSPIMKKIVNDCLMEYNLNSYEHSSNSGLLIVDLI